MTNINIEKVVKIANNRHYSRTEESKDCWETPPYFIKLLDDEVGFTVDAAASPENHLFKKYFTKKQNGLNQSWRGERVFVNPPFSEIDKWVEKAYREAQDPNTLVVMIIPSRTDTDYWHEYCMKADEIRLCHGRVNFLIKCDMCRKSVSKTIFYKKKKLRLCKFCYARITGESKTGSGATFPLAIIIFDKMDSEYPLLKSFEHKKFKNNHEGPTLEQFIEKEA